jgi:PAS domain S-box-containing protein
MARIDKATKHTLYSRQNSLKTIGFLGIGTQIALARKQWPGLLNTCKKYNINLLYVAGEQLRHIEHYSQANVLFDIIKKEHVDGLICWGSTLFPNLTPEEIHTFLAQYQPLPIVSLQLLIEGIPALLHGSYNGVYEAMCHLIEIHGYRRLAFIQGPLNFFHAQARLRAYTEALQAHGLPVVPELISSPVKWSLTDGMQAVQELFDERKLRPKTDIEALVAVNDGTAAGAMQALFARGINVPRDIAVTGFNNDLISQLSTPSLTTAEAPFFDLGVQAVELLLAMMDGKSVPPETLVPSRLVVRQSCGCLSKAVSQAACRSLTVTDEKLDVLLTNKRGELLQAMTHGMAHLKDAREWANRFVDLFLAAMTQDQPQLFLIPFGELLRLTAETGSSLDIWHETLSIFRHHILPCLKEQEQLIRAEGLCQQARTELGDAIKEHQLNKEELAKKSTAQLQVIEAELITTFDINGLMDILFKSLPNVGIPACYLALYEDQGAPTEWVRLILAFTEKGRIALEPGGKRMRASELVPDSMLPEKRRINLILEALYFQKEQIGFILLDAELFDSSVYGILCSNISTALFGALLIKRVQENAAVIARQKYVLDTFLETVPDRIWFKDQVGRFTRMNKAHAHRLGLQKPGEEVGKTEAEIRGKEIGQRVSADEQKIMETGQPILNKEVEIICPSGNPDWSLVTKMPLHDENGMIIGTFGISRDITELKQVQQALEKANQEITKLNVNLTDENQRMHMEMDLARRIQTALLPQVVTNAHPDFEIAALMMPAAEVGGDYYDISLDRENSLWLSIGDVSGHGVTPGLIMMMAQTIHTTITANYQATARDIVININKVLVKNVGGRLGENHFMTFTTLKYLGDGRFQFAGKHLELVVYRHRTKTSEEINSSGMYLNCMPDIASCTKNDELALEIGDLLVLYTDGLTEARNGSPDNKSEMFGLHRFMELVQKYGEQEVEICRDALIKDVLKWSRGVQEDDMSLVVARRIK